MHLRPALGLALVVLGLLVSAERPVAAADWVIVPQIKMEGQYDSNINFSFVKPKSDFILNLAPGTDFTYASETTRLTGKVALSGLIYARDSSLDVLNQYYTVQGQQQVTPRLAFSVDGGFSLDTTLYEELTASGFLMNRSRRQSLRAAPGLAFNLTERALLKLGYAFTQTTYQEPQFNDYSQHTVNLQLNYLLKNAKTTVAAIILGRAVNYPTIDNYYRNLGTYAGLEHKFTEDWSVSLFGGLNYNRFISQTAVLSFGTFPVVRVRQQKRETFSLTPYFNIEGQRKWEKAGLAFGYKLDQSASGGGTVLEYHNAYARVNYQATERFGAGMGGSLYYSTGSSPGSTYDNLVLYFSPELNYKITERLSAVSGYRYGWRHDLARDRTTDRHFVWINLSYAYPLHYQR
jgi:hypothetical protein